MGTIFLCGAEVIAKSLSVANLVTIVSIVDILGLSSVCNHMLLAIPVIILKIRESNNVLHSKYESRPYEDGMNHVFIKSLFRKQQNDRAHFRRDPL